MTDQTRRIAKMLSDLAQEAQPSITKNGKNVIIVYKNQRFEIPYQRTAVTNESVVRLR